MVINISANKVKKNCIILWGENLKSLLINIYTHEQNASNKMLTSVYYWFVRLCQFLFTHLGLFMLSNIIQLYYMEEQK